MHYYQFTIINGFNGWISCQVNRYKRFATRALMTRYLRRLQRDHSCVSVCPVTAQQYFQAAATSDPKNLHTKK